MATSLLHKPTCRPVATAADKTTVELLLTMAVVAFHLRTAVDCGMHDAGAVQGATSPSKLPADAQPHELFMQIWLRCED